MRPLKDINFDIQLLEKQPERGFSYLLHRGELLRERLLAKIDMISKDA